MVFFFLNVISDPNSRVLHLYKKVPLFPSIWMSNNLSLSSNCRYLYITVVSLGISRNRGRCPPRHEHLKDSRDDTFIKHQRGGWTCVTQEKSVASPSVSSGSKRAGYHRDGLGSAA